MRSYRKDQLTRIGDLEARTRVLKWELKKQSLMLDLYRERIRKLEIEINELIEKGEDDTRCPKCNAGTMKQLENGHVLMSHPPLYPHKCDNCGYEHHYKI